MVTSAFTYLLGQIIFIISLISKSRDSWEDLWQFFFFSGFCIMGLQIKRLPRTKHKNSGVAFKSETSMAATRLIGTDSTPSRTQTHTVPGSRRLCTGPPQGTGQPPPKARGHWGLLSHKILVLGDNFVIVVVEIIIADQNSNNSWIFHTPLLQYIQAISGGGHRHCII